MSYRRSRRSTAPFSPFKTASYSSTIRSLYSGVKVRRLGLAAGSTPKVFLRVFPELATATAATAA
ncbi:hypothetical protein [Streptomyces nigrescens]|uniref:hypothetical protein n=1 Tax=Streptomyces nigrescens TaxID=1920 RepID=UPI00348ADA16